MKDKIKLFLEVEAVMLLIFCIMGYTMFHSLCRKYWNGSDRTEHNYWSQLCERESMDNYCTENGLDPFYNKSPEDMLSECIGTFRNNSTSSGWVEGTYIIAKCYDKNKELIAEAGDIIEFSDKETTKVKYAYPDRYFSPEQMQKIYDFEEKYGSSNIEWVEGYYEGEQFALTALRITDQHDADHGLEIKNQVDKETIRFDGVDGIYGTFLRTQAKKRPVSYHSDMFLTGLFEYFAERYEASRAEQIQAYNEEQFEAYAFKNSASSINTEWVEGTSGRGETQEFTYQGETYYLVYSVLTDWNYVAFVDSWLSYILAQIFYFLQLAVVVFTVLLYKINQKKKRLDYAKVILTNGVAHEMKTPIAVIKNYGECIEEHINPEKEGYYLESILNEADRMNDMVVHLLNYTRLSNTEYKIKKELVALDELAIEALKEKEKAIHQKSLNVTFRCEETIEVVCDGPLIKMVIENYLSNAIQHTPENQNIDICISKSSSRFRNRVICRVYNQGSFISIEERKNIWDVFYRGDKARGRKENSTGFGLAICKHIIKLHKGKYGCVDKVNGIEFYFFIPIK